MTGAQVLPLDRIEGREALKALKTARRRNRIAQLDYFDAFYKAYITAIVCGISIYGVAGQLGESPISATTLPLLRTEGPGYLGLIVAVAAVIGLRSGGRGGPLALERADVRHALMAPIDRRDSLRRPAISLLRHGIFLGGAVGGAAGLIAPRRLPGLPAGWIASGVLFGAAVALTAYGLAMIVGGLRLPRWVADTIGLVILLWTGWDAVMHLHTSPFSWIGFLALMPLEVVPWTLGGLLFAALAGIVGALVVQGCSIEAAERRSRLIGQLRFAATLQDVRTVMVLQRQLAQERMRSRPLIKIPSWGRSFTRKGQVSTAVFIRRSLNSFMRWPYFRTARLLVITAIAGFAICGVWAGTGALVVVAGLALWVIALDLLEPLAQETDHPDRLKSSTMIQGSALLRHLLVPGIGLFLLVLVASIPAWILGDKVVVGTLLFPMVIACTILPLGAGALAVTRQANLPSGHMQTPEVAGAVMLWHILVPPTIAILAVVPLIPARAAWMDQHNATYMFESMKMVWYAVVAVGSWGVAWIRYGAELRESMVSAGARATDKTETEQKAGDAKKAGTKVKK